MDPAPRQPPALRALDLDIGARGTPLAPVVQAFADRGLSIGHDTIRDLRRGRSSGRFLAVRFAAIERLHANDASLKTTYCLRLLRTAAELRAPSYVGVRPYVT